jgi:hypothetical protein
MIDIYIFRKKSIQSEVRYVRQIQQSRGMSGGGRREAVPVDAHLPALSHRGLLLRGCVSTQSQPVWAAAMRRARQTRV